MFVSDLTKLIISLVLMVVGVPLMLKEDFLLGTIGTFAFGAGILLMCVCVSIV